MILIIYANLLDDSFKKYNYKDPQPLIKIFGTPILNWILNNINAQFFKQIIIIYNDESYHLDINIKNNIENNISNNITFQYFCFQKTNIIETIYNILNKDDMYNEQILYMNTSNFYYDDITQYLLNINENILFYNDHHYDKNNDQKMLKGVYYFHSSITLNNYLSKLLILNNILSLNNNLSIEQIVNLMINDNIIFHKQPIVEDKIISLETPLHIRLFCNNFPKIHAINQKNMIYKKRICVNIDDLMINNKHIDYVKYLKKIGNIIILTTHNAQLSNTITSFLSDNHINYDEIYYNKPNADFYIDSKNVVFNNIEKDLGFYNNKIDCREFNDVILKDIKTYKKISEDLSGEIYYYLNIPSDIKDIFPIMFNYDESLNKWYEMENIDGIPISHLYLNEDLTISEFNNILGTINRIHNSNTTNIHININTLTQIQTQKQTQINIYGNYAQKLKHRYENYDYSRFTNSESTYNKILLKLEEYEYNNLGKISVIHGDAVFTNILINKFGKIKLIDMRGTIGNIYSIYGDKLYDLAKLYQSIIGYDEILENKKISYEYKQTIKNHYENWFINIYGHNYFIYLKYITASLLFSLIPLHNNDKCYEYYKLIDSLLYEI